ncbi:MAG TPA: hypothetical protein VFV34_18445, partial [Blastocatellia bacterium]|nr:hypothetical protein [Blastocatellia bacterium]
GQGMLLKEPIEMRGEKAVYAVWGFWREGDTMETFARHTMTAWINWRFSGMSAAERAKTIAVIETIPGLGESELAPSEISAGCFYPLGLTQKLLSQFRIASGEIAREKQRAKEIEAEEAAVPVGSEEVATRPPPTEPAPGVRKTPGEQPSKRGEPTKGNWEVLAGNEPLAQRYLKQMQHFAGLPLSPSVSALASGGLTAEELTTIVGESAVYKHYTDLFTQSYTEFQSAGGSDLERFAPLVETVLQQFTWGNPTAVSNLLSIGKGKSWIPEEAKQLGIAHRLEGWLLYDENGAPLRSITGQQWRDPGYVGARQPSWGFNIGEISDPALRGILNSLRQQVGDPNRMVVQAARALHENIELVKPKVAEGLTEEVIKKFEDALPMFIGFLAGHGLAQLLTMSGNPYLVAIGVALKALLAAAGYIMDIDFAASAMERLLLAARFLSRVARDDNGKLTDLSLEYLDKAAVPLRDMVADLAMLTAFVGFGRLLAAIKGRGGERPRIECHSCAIEPKPGEARQAGTVEKSVPVEPSKAGPEAKPRAAEPGAPEAKPSAVEPGAPEVKPAPTEPGAPEAKHPAEPVTPKAEEPKARKRKTKEPTLEEQQRQTRTESLTSQLQNKKDLHRTIVDEIVDITRELKDLREQQRQKPTTERANTIRDLEAQQRQLASESSLVLDETARLDRKIAESKLPLYDKVRAATPTAKAAEGALKRAAGKDQVSGQTASNLQVDHLNPVKEVTTYEGFDRLSWEQQKTACDLPGNLVVMEGGANASKGSRSWEEWPQWQDFYKDPAVKARMLALEAAAHIEIKNYIAETLKSSK